MNYNWYLPSENTLRFNKYKTSRIYGVQTFVITSGTLSIFTKVLKHCANLFDGLTSENFLFPRKKSKRGAYRRSTITNFNASLTAAVQNSFPDKHLTMTLLRTIHVTCMLKRNAIKSYKSHIAYRMGTSIRQLEESYYKPSAEDKFNENQLPQ